MKIQISFQWECKQLKNSNVSIKFPPYFCICLNGLTLDVNLKKNYLFQYEIIIDSAYFFFNQRMVSLKVNIFQSFIFKRKKKKKKVDTHKLIYSNNFIILNTKLKLTWADPDIIPLFQRSSVHLSKPLGDIYIVQSSKYKLVKELYIWSLYSRMYSPT